MEVYAPHKPAHKSDEFWYYPKEAILFYENEGQPSPTSLAAKHSERGRWEHRELRRGRREHFQPHGIKFKDGILTPNQRDRNATNAELVIRLWHETALTATDEETRRNQLLLVPKFLALFLEAKRTRMYEAEALTQAFILMQTRALTDRNNAVN